LLAQVARFAGIEGEIIHGRYDVVCPVDQAFSLAAAWPNAKLTVVEDAGHAASEPGITDALIRATDRFAERLAEHQNGRG